MSSFGVERINKALIKSEEYQSDMKCRHLQKTAKYTLDENMQLKTVNDLETGSIYNFDSSGYLSDAQIKSSPDSNITSYITSELDCTGTSYYCDASGNGYNDCYVHIARDRNGNETEHWEDENLDYEFEYAGFTEYNEDNERISSYSTESPLDNKSHKLNIHTKYFDNLPVEKVFDTYESDKLVSTSKYTYDLDHRLTSYEYDNHKNDSFWGSLMTCIGLESKDYREEITYAGSGEKIVDREEF